MPVRTATPNDISAMVDLSERFRATFEHYQPRMWRKAAGSRQAQTAYFGKLLTENPNVIALVHEAESINGLVIASLISAPPVYDPGGLTCLIDDFCVAEFDIWQSVGVTLFQAVTAAARSRGAVQVVVICPHLDEAKRAMLRGAGLSIASEWYTREL